MLMDSEEPEIKFLIRNIQLPLLYEQNYTSRENICA